MPLPPALPSRASAAQGRALRARPWAALAALALASAALVPACISALGAPPDEEAVKQLSRSPHFGAKQRTFINPVKTDQGFQRSPWEMMGRMWSSPDASPPQRIPVVPQPEDAFKARWAQGVRVTWVGHATVLVEIDGMRVLTDPIWSERCSPVGFAGPKRFHAPGIPLKDLPEIDAVIISHDHYDHLDEQTALVLAKRGVPFYVPLGVGSHLRSWGIERVQELDWWEQVTLSGPGGQTVTLQATPARHFSGRSVTDRNRTQWASWAILGSKHRVYFGGDTGYFPGFKEIGQRLGPFDLTIMPIGAYDEAWSQIHLNPEEAVRAHRDVQGRVMMPIHWGTFDLALHTWREPMLRLERAAHNEQVSLITPLPGQLAPILPKPEGTPGWWRDGAQMSEPSSGTPTKTQPSSSI